MGVPLPQTVGALLVELRRTHPPLAHQLADAMASYPHSAEPFYDEALAEANHGADLTPPAPQSARRCRRASNVPRKSVFGVDRLFA